MNAAPQKKILFVVTTHGWGGTGRYVYDLARMLKNDFRIAVAVPQSTLLAAKLKHERIGTIDIPADDPNGRGRTGFWTLFALFRSERPDIVHLNSMQPMIRATLAARLAGIPRVVVTAHGWSFNEPVPWFLQMWRWTTSAIMLLLVSKAISVSYFNGLQAPLTGRIAVIHNGIEKPDYLSRNEARKALMRRAAIPQDAFWVGTIAELHVNKGIDILIQAAYLVDEIQVIVIGEGTERPDLEKLIADLDLKERVHLVGFIDSAARYLKAFDTFALPSRTEALGYVLIEAGMAEVPVIASAVGGIPELVSDQITGDLVHAFSDVKLAESLQEFKESPNTCRRYAEALKHHVEKHFTLDGMIRRTKAVYEN